MFVYYKLYREPVSPTISTTQQSEKWQSPVLRLCTRTQEAFVLLLFLDPPSLLANRPLLLQPQQAPHKHKTEVANPQYLLH